MRLKFILPVFFLVLSTAFSQNIEIKGQVKDEKDEPIAYANIILKKSDSQEVVSGTTTNEDGYFVIDDIVAETYILQVRFLGYTTQTITVKVFGETILKDIVLIENVEELKSITITAKRPTVQRKVDRLVFNVENSTLSNNNVLDVLKYTPGVIVSDNNISVKNSTPTVYINDRKIHLSIQEVMQLLEGTTAGHIKSVEVITNPPARYEAEGGSIINIITSKNIVAGYNGSIFGNYRQGFEFPKYSFGTSHFFKAKKLNTYLNYNINPRKDYRNIKESINFFDTSNSIDTKWETDYNRVNREANNNINGNIDYEINKSNLISFSSNMLISPREYTKKNVSSLTEVFDANNNLDSLFDTRNNSVNEVFNLAFSLDYLKKLGDKGEKINFNMHYTSYDASLFQDVNTGYFYPDNALIRNNRFQTFSSQIIKLYTAQADYELPLKEGSIFETGLKYSNINSKSILDQFSFENGIKMEDFENSDIFLYDENNYAAYLSYSIDWNTWNLKIGARAEFTETKGNSLVTNTLNKNDYFKLFPSLYLKHSIGNNDEVYISYNKRIYRPRYRELNPFKFFLNDNSYVTGDPSLRPEIDDSFILGYTINNKYTFEAYYRYENDPTIEITFQDNEDRILKITNTNIDHNISYGLDFTTYTEIIPKWNLYVLSSLFYDENNFYALESNNELIKNDNWNFYCQVVNYFGLLKDNSMNLDISYVYISQQVDGPRLISARSGLNINLRKTLWDNRASLSLGVVDIFNTQNFSSTIDYLNQDSFLKSNIENRLFTFGFNYKFGNFRLNRNQKTKEKQEERERLEE